MRAAIYARYSSEAQQEASIEDQIRGARLLVEENGWHVAEIFHDRAISGATTLRPGFQDLMAAARAGRIDVVVAEGIDRLSRDQETIAAIYKQLRFASVAIMTRSEGDVSELHIGLKGTMNALFLKDLALKTHRGLEGRVRGGKSAGGRAYGYRVVRMVNEAGEPLRGDRAIEETEARVVRRIFESFRQGMSPMAIARDLNADGIPGPNGRKWRDTAIRGHATRKTGILRNPLYAGKLVWNRQRYIRDPMTGRRVARPNPESAWIVQDVPELKIVDEPLWQAVESRLNAVRASPQSRAIRDKQFWKDRRPRHLLTGLVHCAACGGVLSAIGKDYLACRAAKIGACESTGSIKRSRLEEAVLDGLKSRLLSPKLVEAFIRDVHEEMNRTASDADASREHDQRDLETVTRKLEGLYDAIADGLRSSGLQQKLVELETRKALLEEKLAARAPVSPPRLHPRLADRYRAKVEDLHNALSSPKTRTEAAEILRGLIERVDVLFTERGPEAELIGDIVKLVALPGGGATSSDLDGSVKVVAGAGFEPTTFRL